MQSREYKMLLQAQHFQGGRRQVQQTAQRWWSACAARLATQGLQATGASDRAKQARLIRFYDTPDHLLTQRGYSVRERCVRLDDHCELTLKFGHPDCYVAQDRDMSMAETGEIKFEADIKPVLTKHRTLFSSLYSVSATQELPHTICLDRLDTLLGDIHQPLHAADNDDRGRNEIKVRLPDGRKMNLHAAWDTSLVEGRFGGQNEVTVAQGLAQKYAAPATEWPAGQVKLATIQTWVGESDQRAKEIAGRHRGRCAL